MTPLSLGRGAGGEGSLPARGGAAPCCADRHRRHRCGPRGRSGPLLPFLRTPWRSTPSLFRHCRMGTGRKIVPGRSADQQRPGPHRCGPTCPASCRSLPGRPPRQLPRGGDYSQYLAFSGMTQRTPPRGSGTSPLRHRRRGVGGGVYNSLRPMRDASNTVQCSLDRSREPARCPIPKADAGATD